jgi:molybdopterin-guanine dinucleotide biosynthesis protein
MKKVIKELKKRGHRVGAVKYDSHGFDVDRPEKDGYRMTAAGGETLICRGKDNDSRLIAVAGDKPLELDVPLYDINDAAGIADFIEDCLLRKA